MKRALGLACVVSGMLLVACASGGSSKAPIEVDDDGASAADAGPAPEPDAAPIDDEEDEEEEVDPTTQEGVCGDQVCNINENCASCAPDCDSCPVCTHAPTCTGSAAVPTSAMHLASFDNMDRNLYESGVDEMGNPLGTALEATDCVAPELRMRIRQINVVRDGVSWPTNGGLADLYCVISASDGVHSEVMITPLQQDVGDDHPPLIFPPEAATFWGQGKAWQTLNNLSITYQCFLSQSNEGYTKVFEAIQDGANEAGGIAGPWGWAFGVGGVAAGLIAAAIPKANDESRINVQQAIDASMLLELTNGRRWVIRGQGDDDGPGGIWDWSIEVEAWGCSNARIPEPK